MENKPLTNSHTVVNHTVDLVENMALKALMALGFSGKGKGNIVGNITKRNKARAKNKLKYKSKIAQKMKQKGKR